METHFSLAADTSYSCANVSVCTLVRLYKVFIYSICQYFSGISWCKKRNKVVKQHENAACLFAVMMELLSHVIRYGLWSLTVDYLVMFITGNLFDFVCTYKYIYWIV